MANGVQIGEKVLPLLHPLTGHPIPVFGPGDTGMEFKIGTGFNKPRKVDITLGVIHWTGSENAIETMFKVLNGRKLGVEFAISPYGSLYQFCDPTKVDTADAGAANKISWGVEIVNAGVRRANTLWREPKNRKLKLGPRPQYDTVIHGRKMKCWDFYPAQTATLCALNRLLVDALPTYGPDVCTEPGVMDWANFKGAVGHLNITERKTDPGTRVMQHLDHYMKTGQLHEDIAGPSVAC